MAQRSSGDAFEHPEAPGVPAVVAGSASDKIAALGELDVETAQVGLQSGAVGFWLGAMSRSERGLRLPLPPRGCPISPSRAAPLPPAKCHRFPPFSGHCAWRRLASGIRETTEDAL
jgi:hypothetical protein